MFSLSLVFKYFGVSFLLLCRPSPFSLVTFRRGRRGPGWRSSQLRPHPIPRGHVALAQSLPAAASAASLAAVGGGVFASSTSPDLPPCCSGPGGSFGAPGPAPSKALRYWGSFVMPVTLLTWHLGQLELAIFPGTLPGKVGKTTVQILPTTSQEPQCLTGELSTQASSGRPNADPISSQKQHRRAHVWPSPVFLADDGLEGGRHPAPIAVPPPRPTPPRAPRVHSVPEWTKEHSAFCKCHAHRGKNAPGGFQHSFPPSAAVVGHVALREAGVGRRRGLSGSRRFSPWPPFYTEGLYRHFRGTWRQQPMWI